MSGCIDGMVAATSLSDIVCGSHVAGCCIETTSDPVPSFGSPT